MILKTNLNGIIENKRSMWLFLISNKKIRDYYNKITGKVFKLLSFKLRQKREFSSKTLSLFIVLSHLEYASLVGYEANSWKCMLLSLMLKYIILIILVEIKAICCFWLKCQFHGTNFGFIFLSVVCKGSTQQFCIYYNIQALVI